MNKQLHIIQSIESLMALGFLPARSLPWHLIFLVLQYLSDLALEQFKHSTLKYIYKIVYKVALLPSFGRRNTRPLLALWYGAAKYVWLLTGKICVWLSVFISGEKHSLLQRHGGMNMLKHTGRLWLSELVRNWRTGYFCKITMSQEVGWDRIETGLSHIHV